MQQPNYRFIFLLGIYVFYYCCLLFGIYMVEKYYNCADTRHTHSGTGIILYKLNHICTPLLSMYYYYYIKICEYLVVVFNVACVKIENHLGTLTLL